MPAGYRKTWRGWVENSQKDVVHELDHIPGYEHEDDGVMAETLAAGERHVPYASVEWKQAVLAFAVEHNSRKGK